MSPQKTPWSGLGADRGEALEKVSAPLVPARPLGAVLAVADAGVDEDEMTRGAHHVGVEA
jgi:hypothetical protein